MKAVVYHKPKDMRVETVDDPKVQDDRDAIVRVTLTAICGSDLHFYNGTVPQPRPQVMGHEFMGTIEEVGPGVTNLRPGDRVVVPFPIACGVCWFCKHGLPIHCENSNPKHYGPEGALLDQKGGGMFGYSDLYGGYPGGQAELVRVPYADFGPRKVPDILTDEQVLFLTDILTTGWSGVEWAGVHGGETVAVFGCGPVGLMAQKCAWVRGAARVIGVDDYDYRLNMAKVAANAETINAKEQDAVQAIRDMTEGRGADVVIDAVGMEADISTLRKLESAVHAEAGTVQAFAMAVSAVRRGGAISVLGVYTTSYDNFPWGQIFEKGLHLYSGQAPVHDYIDHLLELIIQGKIIADDIITHRLPLDEAPHGYEIFNNKEDNCVKVVMRP
ncbi:MAG TPA: zinc-dependent alcohol dehydrogenase [Armatimonadota bacterium]|nr:zinc-dependent alcohol dehydrogenase [Armatimonadota bacterium]